MCVLNGCICIDALGNLAHAGDPSCCFLPVPNLDDLECWQEYTHLLAKHRRIKHAKLVFTCHLNLLGVK